MSDPTTGQTPAPTTNGADPTLGALVNDLTTQVPELIRSEIRLAQAELTEKGKRAGIGVGMFSGAGLLAFFGFGTLIATAVLALSLVMDGWLAALIVTVVLFVGAGVLALLGKNQVQEATPVVPERAVEGVKEDIATVKGQRA
ncbi:MAG: phage holin family protein [Marmoricola sp.]